MSNKAVARSVPTVISACPCGSALAYRDCCQPIHAGAPAATAESLMRARYSAYVVGDDAFIAASWHSTTRPPTTAPGEVSVVQSQTRWLGLDIKRHAAAGDSATVEFVARFKAGGRAGRLHEISRFIRETGAWFYVDGSFPADETPQATPNRTSGTKGVGMAEAKAEKQ